MLMDFAAVTGTNYYLRRQKKWGYLLFIAFLSSFTGLILFLWIRNEMVYRIVAHFFLNTAMVGLAFGIKERKEFLENWAVTYFIVILSGGIMQWLEQAEFFPKGFGVEALATGLLGYAAITYLLQRKRRGDYIYPAKIKKDGVSISLKAYWDSGNQLCDPYTGQDIHIIKEEMAKKLLLEEEVKIRYVPFRSLGEAHGLLKVTNIDELLVFDGKKEIRMEHAAVGIAPEDLFTDKEYTLILHASVLSVY